jgi:hypothetical protein
VSEIDDFLNGGAAEVDVSLGVVTMTCEGQSFAVVWNDSRKSYEGALGGLESAVHATAVAQPRYVTSPRSMLQKRCTVDGVTYRVAEVSVGTCAITFTLTDPSEAR